MKIAIIDFGHVDSILSLAKYLGDKCEVDLYLTFTQKSKSTSIINFKNLSVPNGILNQHLVSEIVGPEIIKYIDSKINLNVFIFNSLSLKDPVNLKLNYELSRILKKKKYDIIHFNGNSAFEILLHQFLSNKPRIQTIHDVKPHSGEGSWNKNLRTKLLSKFKTDFILQSNHSQKEMIEHFKVNKNRTHSIYYGPLEIYNFFSSKDVTEIKNKILFFGRISPYKGIEYLISSMKIISKKIPDVKLTIAGSGKFYFDINEIIKGMNIEVINRYIPNNELVELIKSSSIIVCPYTDATQSGVVMTSFAFYKPVIASDVGGLSEVIKQNVTGKLVPAKDPNAIAQALIEVLCQDDQLFEMNNNIKKLADSGSFSWNNISNETLTVYHDIIKKNK